MNNKILLIEPDYKNKYPPLGLMKIAYFHRYMQHDYVRFTKGRLPDALAQAKWDRIYVTSLFTFEWAATIDSIKYALTLVEDSEKVIVGGIAATLMPEQIYQETGIRPISGLLNEPGKLGIAGDESIDQLIPDYSILAEIEYKYPYNDAYFLSATKGCGMRCGFCAVQTLEPTYVPYIDIKTKIHAINNLFGPKRDLLLMDNNVLRSNCFDQIINDIIEAGFGKNAYYINPKTGKKVKRYVDFNQGLDANFLTPEKARRLGEIALRPARIAFDHIEDRETYEKALRLCAENGITELSNYILYNSENFTGKGNHYQADTPEDLYTRMRITLDLREELNKGVPDEEKINAFSFPMRYIPLSARERGYVGSNWNPKFLRSVQCMLIPTQGKGVGNRSFFEADFGTDAKSFVQNLCMPEKLISARGHFAIGGRGHVKETPTQVEARRHKWERNQRRLSEWKRLYSLLGNNNDSFVEVIRDNEYLPEKLLRLQSDLHKKLYLHYLTIPRILTLLGLVKKESPTYPLLHHYIIDEFPDMYEDILTLIAFSETQQQYMFKNFIGFFGKQGMTSILYCLEPYDFNADKQLMIWSCTSKKIGLSYIDFELIRIYCRYLTLCVLPNDVKASAKSMILKMDMVGLSSILYEYLNSFETKLLTCIQHEQGAQIIKQTTTKLLKGIQLKLNDVVEGLNGNDSYRETHA